MSDKCIIEELRGLMGRNSVCAAHIRDSAIAEITRLREDNVRLREENVNLRRKLYGVDWEWRKEARDEEASS